MTLKEATNFFEILVKQSSNKKDIKRYQNFIDVLNKLETRDFSEDQLRSLEEKLDSLNLRIDQATDRKVLKRVIEEFKKYLKDTYSLTTVGYYTNKCVVMGMLFGVVAGVLIGERFGKSMGISLGISIGMIIGAGIGRHLDAKALAEGNVI